MIVCKYKFDKSIYENLIPVFNDGYTGYTVSDEIDGNIVTRTIECDTLPTVMRFGENTGQYEDNKIGAKAKSLKEVLYADISSITYGNHMFGSCINLTKINTEGWNNNSFASINNMFFCCKSLVNLDVTSLVGDTVVDVGYAFYYCAELYNLTGLESWDTSNVTYMANMFQNCFKLTPIDVSSWDTSNVKNMGAMFANCYKLTSLDVSNWDTSNVTNMWGVFYYCSNLTQLDVSNFDTSKVTDMSHMFYYCTNLTSITFGSNFNTSNVKAMDYMFCNCNKLTSLDVSNFDTSNVTNMSNMFSYCRALTSIDANNWDTSNVTDMSNMFYHSDKLTTLDISNWNVGKVTNMATMFGENAMLQSLDLSNWDTSEVTSMFGMFFGCYALTSLDVSNFDTSVTTNMKAMFGQMRSIKTLNLNNIKAEYSKAVHSDDDRFMINDVNLEKIYLNDLDTLNTVLHYITDRTGKEVGKLVTSIRNKIPSETLTTLTTKNWEIVDIVAQYRYDANTYEDLMPEFNAEFTEDKYRVIDDVHEYELNINWELGKFNGGQYLPPGTIIVDIDATDRVRSKGYITIQPNAIYKTDYDLLPNIAWFDENKNFISYYDSETPLQEICTPINARYMRVFTSTQHNYENINIYRKLVNRTIESVNGDLPTMMRFGVYTSDASTNRELSLLKVIELNTTELTICNRMFIACQNVTSINTEGWTLNKVTNMQYMFHACTNLTSLDVSNFDTKNVTNMSYMFYNCKNLTSLDVSNFDTGNVTDMSNMFYNCASLTSLNVSFNTSNVTRMDYMFHSCAGLTSLDVSNFNTSKVTDMRSMFRDCSNLTSLDLSNFNTSKVTNICDLCYTCCKLTTVGDISNWDTSEVTDMHAMFHNCSSITSLDVSKWDTGKVTSMRELFAYCYNLTSLDVSNFNTSNVTNMGNMFNSCNKLTSLDVSNFDTSKVTSMVNMFANCQSLITLDISNFKFDNCNNITSMLTSYPISLHLPKADLPDFTAIWGSNGKTKYIKCENKNNIVKVISHLPTRTVENPGKILTQIPMSEFTELEIQALTDKNWTISNEVLQVVAKYKFAKDIYRSMIPVFNKEFVNYFVDDEYLDTEDLTGMYDGEGNGGYTITADNIVTRTISVVEGVEMPNMIRFGIGGTNSTKVSEQLKTMARSIILVEDIDISFITDFVGMFRYCFNLSDVYNINNWDISNVTRIGNLFGQCRLLTSLDLSNWDTSKVTNMGGSFSNCWKLTSIGNVSNWDTSKVSEMSGVFQYCNNLTSLDVSNWNTSKVTNMSYMFNGCTKLTSLDVSNWNTSKVTDMVNMFTNTPKLSNIGMLYCSQDTINTISSNLPTTHTQTIWVLDADINKLTSVDGVEFKEYKENGVMINLSSPLLNGDRIEVVEGKLCHYHKMSKVVLDGSEDSWRLASKQPTNTNLINSFIFGLQVVIGSKLICNKFINDTLNASENIGVSLAAPNIHITIQKSKLPTPDLEGFKQWLSENPTTVVYELAEPYYEDITPLQSDIVLETYLECNLDIYTKLPIKTNVSYITNVPSLSTLSMRATEMKESDNIIANLTNMLDNEINE